MGVTKQEFARALSIYSVGAAYDVGPNDEVILITGTGTPRTLTIPTREAVKGRILTFKDAGGGAGTNNFTIDPEGSTTIDGAATKVISTNYGTFSIVCDGTNWFTV